MFELGDVVIYGTDGVCTIKEITERNFGKEVIEYYILEPINRKSEVVYVPVKNETMTKRMRRVISPEEIEELKNVHVTDDSKWIVNERERQRVNKGILLSGECTDLVSLIQTIEIHRKKMVEKGKKLHVVDERIMRDAEKILADEISYVMNIEPFEAIDFIRSI